MLLFASSLVCSREIAEELKGHGFDAFTFARAGLYPVSVTCDAGSAVAAREIAERLDPQVKVRQ